MDNMNLDPEVLIYAANKITYYCKMQGLIMTAYIANMRSLSREWVDDVTMGKLIQEIDGIKNEVIKTMNSILKEYPPYFRKKADEIMHRPIL